MQLDWCLVPHTEQTRKPVGAAVLRPDKTEAIIAAFFAELGCSGYEGMTMDRVAELAGVGNPPRDPIACRPGAPFARARHRPCRALRQPAAASWQ